MSSTIFFFLFIPLLALILLAVNLIFAPHNPYMEKNSAFECGFSSFLGQNRTQFSISFFIFALLFLLFDLEILLVYPYLVSAYTNGLYGLIVMLMFLLALTLGFAFELGKKALFIDSRQMSNVATNATNNSPINNSSTTSSTCSTKSLVKQADISQNVGLLYITNDSVSYDIISDKFKSFSVTSTIQVGVPMVNKKFFSNTSYCMAGESSNDNTSSDLPDLVNSRAIGKWDSSTVPDTVSQRENDTFDHNRYIKDQAENAKIRHDNREGFHKQCIDVSDFVTSKSGKLHSDLESKDIREMAKDINKAEQKEEAQKLYDAYHDEIITVYSVVKEDINCDRHLELRYLVVKEDNKAVNDDTNIEQEKKFITKYKKFINKFREFYSSVSYLSNFPFCLFMVKRFIRNYNFSRSRYHYTEPYLIKKSKWDNSIVIYMPASYITKYGNLMEILKSRVNKAWHYEGAFIVINKNKNYIFKAYGWNRFNYRFELFSTIDLINLIFETTKSVNKSPNQVDIFIHLRPAKFLGFRLPKKKRVSKKKRV